MANKQQVGPKTKRAATPVGGALTIILGWLIGDVMGYPIPDHVLQAGTLVVVFVLNEWSKDDENTTSRT